MKKEKMKLEYLILDPSCFTSVKRLNESFLILDDIFQKKIQPIKPKVVLVSALRSIGYVQQERMGSKELLDVLVGWRLPKKKILGLFTKEYDQLWKKLFLTYDVIFADELNDPVTGKLAKDIEKIGKNSITKPRFQKRGVLNAFWEEIVFCNIHPHTWIICRSNHLQNIFSKKVKTPILQGTSQLKASIKEHHHLHETLRFLCHNMQADALEEFIAQADIAVPGIGSLSNVGLVVVADG